MEEDIKILEKIKDECLEASELTIVGSDESKEWKREAQALENLIKEYRELEEENKQLKEYIYIAPNLDEITAVKYSHIQRDAYFRGRAEEQQKAEQIIYENYIPKSKIKEKLEEIDKVIPTAQGAELLILEAKKDFAQELLEEE